MNGHKTPMIITTIMMKIIMKKNHIKEILTGAPNDTNGVHGPEPRSSEENTSSNPQVSALIPRPAFNGIKMMCQCHGSNQNSHPPVLVRKPLCNQFIHNQISSRGGVLVSIISNSVILLSLQLNVFFATVDRGSIMGRIYRCSVIIYGSRIERAYC